jgi:hypothetical protein
MYDAVIIGGISYDKFGRPLGPYRLRTAAGKHGYAVKVIDCAWAFTEEQLISLLQKLITVNTRVLGISAAWFDRHVDNSANIWATDSFFKKIRSIYPDLEIVTGGTKINLIPLLFSNSDWFITGFSDIAFVKLLDYIYRRDTKLFFWKESGVKIIKGDSHYPVINMDELETVFEIDDGFQFFQPMPLEVSRGCIFKCAFCTHPFLGKKTYEYIRTPESLASEIERNYRLFGTYRYTISDDTFNDSYEKIDILQQAVNMANLKKFEFVSYIRPELLVTKNEMISKLIDLGLKGCHLGIESLNDGARKSIGKGMDISRVLNVVEELRKNDVRIHASFIVGLPDETKNDIITTTDFLINNRNKYFHSWNFNGLGLMRGVSGETYSLIEKDPGSYGYETSVQKDSIWLGWRNSIGMTNTQANELAKICNSKSYAYQKFAGWTLAQAWFHNVPQVQIDHATFPSVKINDIIKSNGLSRAKNYYNKIVL